MAPSVGVDLADTLPVAFARLARRHGGVTALDDGAEPVTWGELATRARLFGVALDEQGVRRGDSVAVCLPDAGLRIAVDQAALAAGGIVTGAGGGEGAGWRVDPGGLSRGGGEVTPLPALLAVGREADRSSPDRFERLAATVAAGDVAVAAGGHRFTHDQVLWGLRSVISWLDPVVGADAAVGAGLPVVVPGRWDEPGRSVLGVWWPLVAGATGHVIGPDSDTSTGVIATMAGVRPVVAIAEPVVWAALAGAVRRRLATAGSSGPRRYLGAGRARAAGERLGSVERLGWRALDRTWGSRLRRDLGLDRCRWAVCLGRPDEAVRRDLAAVGLDLVATFMADGVVGPVTATAPGTPGWSSGWPLPGRSVTVDAGEVVVGGAGVSGDGGGGGGARRTGRRGRLTADGQLRLAPRP